jgi:hypothetical protein
MTVCIAALADVGQSLVLACDGKLSAESFSADDVAMKMYPLTPQQFQWWALVAGSIAHVIPVLERAEHKLIHLTDASNTRETVERAVLESYQEVRKQLAEDEVLSPVGMSWELLSASPSLMPTVSEKLAQVNLGCEFLIAGFDWSGSGYISSIANPGTVKNHNMCGYEAIGTGSYSALAALMHHSVNQEMGLARVLYHVCEAKFMAESADGVGKTTHVKVAWGKTKMDASELSQGFIAGLRNAWEKEGRPRVPSGLLAEIDGHIRKHPAFVAHPTKPTIS